MSDQQQQITREQYVNLSKIESLAGQNANQAVRIAELETQINLLQMQIKRCNSRNQQKSKIAGEDPVEVEDLGQRPTLR